MKLTAEILWRALCDRVRKKEYSLKEYTINDGKKHRFAIICPGGGYGFVSNSVEGVIIARKLNEMGVSAFVLYYRCCPNALFPAPMDDLACALADILDRAHSLNLQTDSYSIIGFSAGGHLAASFGTEAVGYQKYNLPKPGTLILCYPVISMGELSHSGTRRNLLGMAPTQDMIKLTSVEKQVTPAYPPTFIWCGDADRIVSPRNSFEMADALKQQNVAHVLKVYRNVGHAEGIGVDTAAAGWLDEAVNFWMQS